jgi:uncharacterized protein
MGKVQIMKTTTIQFENSSGLKLSARLDLPDTPYVATSLFAHCFTCGKDILAASRISRRLVSQGFAVLRFDFTGLGVSEGDFSDTNFSSNIDDLIDASVWLENNYESPSLVIGHSLGGTAVLAAAKKLPKVKAFVTIASPSDPKHMFKLFGENSIEEILKSGYAEVLLENRKFLIKRQFLVDAEEAQVLKQVEMLKRPILIMHSPFDLTVDIEHATKIFHAAKHPKSFISLGDADHLLSNNLDANFIADVIGSWSKRYILKT